MTAIDRVLTREEARRRLVSHLALNRSVGTGVAGVRKVLGRLRCIQIDPLDAIGTNADLVVMARVEGVGRGEIWNHLFPRHAFEHFAKERCILPAEAFPRYREQGHAAAVGWWRHSEREERMPRASVDAVLAEIRAHGPVSARDLADHGSVEPLDWSGWKGTGKATTMALEILWTRCDIVVCGRNDAGAKLYDVPERALGRRALAPPPEDSFDRWALSERVLAAGLLARAGGPPWSMLSSLRASKVPDSMLESGELVEVAIDGSPRRYLTTPMFLETKLSRNDDRVRILGPLDPLLWDRLLVRTLFDFEYAWEVYKPSGHRRWGWYVCPLLHRDRFVGRVEARIEKTALIVQQLWIEREVEPERIRLCLERHAEACGCDSVRWPGRSRIHDTAASRWP